jgi:hypothetical protein
MSRQNKVNPGMYTQRGRLTQDDAAREIAKQRNVGSPNTWQPVQRDHQPPMMHEPEAAEADDRLDGDQAAAPAAIEKAPARAKAARPAAARSAKRSSRPASRRSAKPAKTAARTKTAPRKSAPAKKATTATKRGKAKSARPARAAKPKAKAAKRRKS